MRKNIWRLLQVTWLALAMLTIYNSMWTLGSGASYCSGMFCASNSDCGDACACNSLDSTCYEVGLPTT
jgi:hypothetical protein